MGYTTIMDTINVCGSAREKMRKRGIQYDYIKKAFAHGEFFYDNLDKEIMHVRFHGHELIFRKKYNSLFVITINTDVKKEHTMKPMERSPFLVIDTADHSSDWRKARVPQPAPDVSPTVFKNVKRITENVLKKHEETKWVGETKPNSLKPLSGEKPCALSGV